MKKKYNKIGTCAIGVMTIVCLAFDADMQFNSGK